MYRFKYVFLVLCIFLSPVWAKEFWVKNSLELHSTMHKVKHGDTIIMKDGIWRDLNIVFRAEGNSTAPVTLRAEHRGKVVISGNASLVIEGNHLVVDGLTFKSGQPSRSALIRFGKRNAPAHHCRLTHTVVDDFNDANLSKRYDWVVIVGGSHNRVDHCRFTRMKNRGVTLKVVLLKDAAPNYHTVDHNEFSYRSKGKGNGHETIRIGSSTHSLQNSRTTVKDNYFYKCDGEIEIISSKSCENRYLHNIFEDSKGMLTLRHGNRCLVKDNLFLARGNRQMGGVRIVGEGHRILNNYFIGVGATPYRAAISFMNALPNPPLYEYTQVKACEILYNTFIDTKYTIAFGANYKKGKYPLAAEDIIFNSNLIIGSNKPLPTYIGKQIPKIKYENNMIFKSKLAITGLKGFQYLNPNVRLNTNVWVSSIIEHFQESILHPIKKQNAGPQKKILK